ncbi:type II toxin-antitoxin system HicA family toxin [Alcaligenaceae bacterium B3P038]|nr:type II toxin-antitoxin system HicA family toxin [Alcaligenaceae bacterium B3P038]
MSGVYHPLTYRQVIQILVALGFSQRPNKGTSHEQWVKTEPSFFKVTVDKHESPFDAFLISSMARQAGVTKKEFYAILKG